MEVQNASQAPVRSGNSTCWFLFVYLRHSCSCTHGGEMKLYISTNPNGDALLITNDDTLVNELEYDCIELIEANIERLRETYDRDDLLAILCRER
jgi:hypothetical protein